MYPLNYSWAIHPRGNAVEGQLRVIGKVKLKRGNPLCAVRYEHGNACLVVLNASFKCEYVYFDKQGRKKHTSEAVGLWGEGYIQTNANGYSIFDHAGNHVREFAGCDRCECIGGRYFMLGGHYIGHLSCDARLDVSGMCGYVTAAIENDETIYVVGTSGSIAARTCGNGILMKWHISACKPNVYPRIVPLDTQSIAFVSVNRDTHSSDFYRLSISDGTLTYICEAPFEAEQDTLREQLSYGILPLGDGVVCFGSAGSVETGFYYCDYAKRQWRPLPIPTRGLNTERQVSVGGRIVSLLDDPRGGRTLRVHNLEFEKTFEQRLWRRYPSPSCETLRNICQDGTIVVAEGNRNQEVVYYEIV